MKTNVLDKIEIAKSGHPRARFNLSHDVNTTCGFGEVQPLCGRLTPPDTKTILDLKSLVRLAPMVAPTFGRMKFKTWTSFVPMSDLSKNFDALLAQTVVSRTQGNSNVNFQPVNVPNFSLGVLSALCLIGADLTLYVGDTSATASGGLSACWIPTSVNELRTALGYSDDNWYFDLGFMGRDSTDSLTARFDNYLGIYLDVGKFCGAGTTGFLIPTALAKPLSSSASVEQLFESPALNGTFNGAVHVPLPSADLVFTFNEAGLSSIFNGKCVSIAFRLSAFGKRLRKVLLGLGYQIDLSSVEQVSAMPLFAYYKAYYELFGIKLYENWDSTPAAKILYNCDNNMYAASANSTPDLDALLYNGTGLTNSVTRDLLVSFIKDLANTWVTDSQDFVSAHTSTLAIGPSARGALDFIDFDSAVCDVINPQDFGGFGNLNSNGNFANIKDVNHGAVDSEVLKRLYRWSNINTVAGKKIADLLRAQGLGDYVDSHKPNFIGYTEQQINIDDVVSSADTFQTSDDSGKLLGEYGGRGISFDQSKNFVFENDSFGYIITLAAIVPESGYFQGIDPSLKCINKFDFYNPEFDALGHDESKLSAVVGSRDWCADNGDPLSLPFGFVPRYTGLKIANNVANGDFSLRGTRDSYLPYTLDKFIGYRERVCKLAQNSDHPNSVAYTTAEVVNSLPVAGTAWRYPTRYPWLANFSRIFANVGTYGQDWKMWFKALSAQEKAQYLYCYNEYDNFLVHDVFNLVQYSPMLPIEKSFQTWDDEAKPNSSVEKA